MKTINNKLLLSKQKLTGTPFRKLLPSMLTMMALCSGVTSIRFAIQDQWSKAVICIFLAALFDGLDGRVARFLKASTKFGAELDSLSDFVSFGVAPAILMYQWALADFPRFGWLFSLLFAMGMALRLARFNTMLEENNPTGRITLWACLHLRRLPWRLCRFSSVLTFRNLNLFCAPKSFAPYCFLLFLS